MCTLYMPDVDKMVSVACEHLKPVEPKAGDNVSI